LIHTTRSGLNISIEIIAHPGEKGNYLLFFV